MFDNSVTRFPGGITNVRESDLFSDMPVEEWTRYHNYFNDFDQYLAADFTTSGTGTAALTPGDGGLLLLTNTGVISEFTSQQKLPAAFTLKSGKRCWGSHIGQVDNVLGLVIAGLLNVTAAPFTGGNRTDGIYMVSTATGSVSVVAAAASVASTAAAVAQLVAGAQFTFRWYWDGEIYNAAPNGRVVYELSGPGVLAPVRGELLPAAAFPSAVLLTETHAVQNGSAAIRTLTLDQVDILNERINILATPTF